MTQVSDRVDSPFARTRQSAAPERRDRKAAPSERAPVMTGNPPPLPLRAMTGWEEEFVENYLDTSNTSCLCNELLARCLVAPGADWTSAIEVVRGLLVAERDRALVALRRISLGPEISAIVCCPACQADNQTDFSLDNLPLDFPVPGSSLEVTLADGTRVGLRLPTAGDQEELLDADVQGTAERRTWLLGRLIERFGDHRREGLDADFARGLPVATRRELEAAIERTLPDFALRTALTCQTCGHGFNAPFDVPAFFFPRWHSAPADF